MALGFSTKAGTLIALQRLLNTARIPLIRVFTVAQWRENRLECLSGIVDSLGDEPWIVRSSCVREDGARSSNAGVFLSILSVDKAGLESAVEQVIASYGEGLPNDEVLIQPMLMNVLRSGVAFSHDPNTCAPYRVINWSEGVDTTAITSGLGGRIWQQAANSSVSAPPCLAPILTLLKELLTFWEYSVGLRICGDRGG